MSLLLDAGADAFHLARRARLSKQTLTTMARALERDGLVESRSDSSDARATRVYLTVAPERCDRWPRPPSLSWNNWSPSPFPQSYRKH